MDRVMAPVRVRRFLHQPREARRTLLASALLLPMVRLALVTIGYRRTQAMLAAVFRQRPAPAGFTFEEGCQVRALVDKAARHGGSRATCLPQALTTWALLRRRGVRSEVCLGARRVDDQLQAHAWVEVAGRSLDGPVSPAGTPYEVFLQTAAPAKAGDATRR
jgi:hypothetical protein